MHFFKFFSAFLVLSVLCIHSFSQNLKPGDTDPKAKTLDADVFYEFNNGAAVIQKGNAYALVDLNGNFLAAYGKYIFSNLLPSKGIYNGIFCLSLNHEAINAKGQLIAKGLDYVTPVPSCPYLLVATRDGIQAINSEDQRFLIKGYNGMMGLGNLSEGFIGYNISPVNGKIKLGFKNLKNEIVIQPSYDKIGSFSDGMAMVANKNEFGEMKYGFVNSEGKEAVPLMYTYQPSDFHCGRSLVYPKANAGFNYAYINKKGDAVIKYTQEMYQKYGDFKNGFFNGYSFNDNYVMDTSGKIVSYEAFFTKFGVSNPADKALKFQYQINRESWTDGQVFTFIRYGLNRPASKSGFIDVANNKSVEGPFGQTMQFYFDPVSKLAYAEMATPDKTGVILKKGYINMQGIFLLVKAEEGKW